MNHFLFYTGTWPSYLADLLTQSVGLMLIGGGTRTRALILSVGLIGGGTRTRALILGSFNLVPSTLATEQFCYPCRPMVIKLNFTAILLNFSDKTNSCQ